MDTGSCLPFLIKNAIHIMKDAIFAKYNSMIVYEH